MAELALLDDQGVVANMTVIEDPSDKALIAALVAAGNHHAGIPVPDDHPAEQVGGVGVGWSWSGKAGFKPPADHELLPPAGG